jgi:hypothetical protein
MTAPPLPPPASPPGGPASYAGALHDSKSVVVIVVVGLGAGTNPLR